MAVDQSVMQGLPTVDPINQANFTVPNASEIQQAVNTLQNAHVTVDQTQLNALINQQQDMATQQMGQMKEGPAPGQSAAEIGTMRGIQSTAGSANAATQNSLAAAANPLAAARTATQAQTQQNIQTASAGAQARAQESAAATQTAQQALASATQGSISGASQRLQADIATANLVQQAIADRIQLSSMQLQGSIDYAEMSMKYQEQARQDYLTMKFAAMKNQQMVMGAIITTVAAVAQAGISLYSKSTQKLPVSTTKGTGGADFVGSNPVTGGYALPGASTGQDTSFESDNDTNDFDY